MRLLGSAAALIVGFSLLTVSCGVHDSASPAAHPTHFQAAWQDSGIMGPADANGHRPCAASYLVVCDANQAVSYAAGCWSDGSEPNVSLSPIFPDQSAVLQLRSAMLALDFAALEKTYVTSPTVSDAVYPLVRIDFFAGQEKKTVTVLSDEPKRLPAGISEVYTFVLSCAGY